MKGNVLGRSPQCHDVSPTALEKGGNVRLDRGAPQHHKASKGDLSSDLLATAHHTASKGDLSSDLLATAL